MVLGAAVLLTQMVRARAALTALFLIHPCLIPCAVEKLTAIFDAAGRQKSSSIVGAIQVGCVLHTHAVCQHSLYQCIFSLPFVNPSPVLPALGQVLPKRQPAYSTGPEREPNPWPLGRAPARRQLWQARRRRRESPECSAALAPAGQGAH